MKNFKTFISIFFLLIILTIQVYAQNSYTISGYIKDASSGELLIGVNIYVPGTQIGTTSNPYGFYSITLKEKENLELKYSFIGYKPFVKTFNLNKDIESNIELDLASKNLSEVEVIAEKNNKISQ